MNAEDWNRCVDAATRGNKTAEAALAWVSLCYRAELLAAIPEPETLEQMLDRRFPDETRFTIDHHAHQIFVTYAPHLSLAEIAGAVLDWENETGKPTHTYFVEDNRGTR